MSRVLVLTDENGLFVDAYTDDENVKIFHAQGNEGEPKTCAVYVVSKWRMDELLSGQVVR